MSTKIIAGSFWLATAAANSYLRARAAGLPAGISSAGRTREQQHVLFVQRFTTNYAASAKFDPRTYQGLTWWRRPGWTNAATPGSPASRHEQGLSLDLPAGGPREWMHAHGAAFGWIGNLVAGEPWHFEYQAARDASTGSPTLVTNPGASVPGAPAITPPTPAPEPVSKVQEDDMIIIRNAKTGAAFVVLGGRGSRLVGSTDLAAYEKAGLKTVNLTPDGYAVAESRYLVKG